MISGFKTSIAAESSESSGLPPKNSKKNKYNASLPEITRKENDKLGLD